jgi:hypothetical protein
MRLIFLYILFNQELKLARNVIYFILFKQVVPCVLSSVTALLIFIIQE